MNNLISEKSIQRRFANYIDLYREDHEEWPHYFHGHIIDSVSIVLLKELYPDDLLEIHSSEYKYGQWENSNLIEPSEDDHKFLVYDTNAPDRFPVTEIWALEGQ